MFRRDYGTGISIRLDSRQLITGLFSKVPTGQSKESSCGRVENLCIKSDNKMKVDMSAKAATARLKRVSQLRDWLYRWARRSL